jgi:hypothetical protein
MSLGVRLCLGGPTRRGDHLGAAPPAVVGGGEDPAGRGTLQPGMSVSFVARKHGLSRSLLFNWRRRMAEGGREAVGSMMR